MSVKPSPSRHIPALVPAVALLMLASSAFAAQSNARYVPFPGKIPVDVQAVASPIAVWVRFESYPGFKQVNHVIIPGLQVPSQDSDSPCEQQMAFDALDLTEQFLADAKQVYITNMRVVTSTDDEGYAPISSDQGSLGQKLLEKGLVRSSTIDPRKPWCKDEK